MNVLQFANKVFSVKHTLYPAFPLEMIRCAPHDLFKLLVEIGEVVKSAFKTDAPDTDVTFH
jgi:hypothetical protein